MKRAAAMDQKSPSLPLCYRANDLAFSTGWQNNSRFLRNLLNTEFLSPQG